MSDSNTPILTPELLAWIGKEGPVSTAEVRLEAIQNYANAVGFGGPDPLYFDEEFAQGTPYGGITAPPMFFGTPFSRIVPHMDLRDDGLPKDDDVHSGLRPPLPLPRLMGGGTEVEFFRPVRPGDRLTRRSKLADLTEKNGRTGPLVFTTIETEYRNEADELVPIVRSSTISR